MMVYGRLFPGGAGLVLLAVAMGQPAQATEPVPAQSLTAQSLISEIRIGAGLSDVGLVTATREGGALANLEMMFVSPTLSDAVWSPRPHIGVSLNLEGDTSQAYVGVTWHWAPFGPVQETSHFAPWRRVFVEFSLGGAIHDGRTEDICCERKALGSRVLFRESLSLGLWLTDKVNLSVMADHISNANLADHNHGLDTISGRLGMTF